MEFSLVEEVRQSLVRHIMASHDRRPPPAGWERMVSQGLSRAAPVGAGACQGEELLSTQGALEGKGVLLIFFDDFVLEERSNKPDKHKLASL